MHRDQRITVDFPIYFSDVFSSEKIIHYCADRSVYQVMIITDDHLIQLYAKKFLHYLQSHSIQANLISIPPGESSKSRETKALIEDQLFSFGCGRDTLLIALGGGVMTDLVGFVAATYCRGIPVIYIPTSLLAMIDAAIGGKTGINTPFGKNTLGTFTQPRAIFIDIQFLRTLSDIEYIGALFEIIKHALISDEAYFQFIEHHKDQLIARKPAILSTVILRSCEIKAMIAASDEKENHQREILNFGHTIAHALEYASDYQITHGQAVGIGLIIESLISHRMGYLSIQSVSRIQQLLQYLLSLLPPAPTFSIQKIMNALQWDKKNRKSITRYVLLKKIGAVFCENNSYAHSLSESLQSELSDSVIALVLRDNLCDGA